MSRDEVTGTFLSGGFRSPELMVELPDPNDVTPGTLYRDENRQIWKLTVRHTEDRRLTAWVPVTAVSAERQKRDRTLAAMFGLAAFVGAFLVLQLALALDLSLLWGVPLMSGVFAVFGGLWWRMSDQADHQVVLPLEAADGFPDVRPTIEVQPGTDER